MKSAFNHQHYAKERETRQSDPHQSQKGPTDWVLRS